MKLKCIILSVVASLSLAASSQPVQQQEQWEWYLDEVVNDVFVGRNDFEYYYMPSSSDMEQQRNKGEVTYFLNSPEGLSAKKTCNLIDRIMASYDDIQAMGTWVDAKTIYWKEFRFEKNKFRFNVKREALDDGTYYVSVVETSNHYKSLGKKNEEQAKDKQEAKPKTRKSKEEKSTRRSTRDRRQVTQDDVDAADDDVVAVADAIAPSDDADAAADKAPIAKVADRVSSVFVPAIILIALVTIVVWLLVGESVGFALARGIAVLVISCPCALGLATPVAIMVGSGLGARHGILFKTAAALEKTGRARTVVLDKTGTITTGEPQVTDILPAPGIDESTLLRLACALERGSEHPLARAIVQAAADANVNGTELPEIAENIEALPGRGLHGTYEGARLAGGNAAFIGEMAPVPSGLREKAEQLAQSGKTPLFFSHGDKFLGFVAVADVIRQESAQAIRELHDMGLRVIMLTGDNARTAQAIGAQAGVDEVIAEVLPQDKEETVRKLQAQAHTIMVGDGINDAPALTRAGTGIAIGAGTDVAIDAAEVVLVKNRLSDVPAAIRLSRATLRNIYQNLFWAFFYNALGIPLAAGVWIKTLGWQLSPMFGAAAMSLSSFCVVSNALRLNLCELYPGEPSPPKEETMEKTLKIEGMMCGHCEARVKQCLEALPEVASAVVSHEKGTAVLTLKQDIADSKLKQIVEEQGYKVL